MQQLISDLQAAQIGDVRTNERLAPYTTWKIGGPADILVIPDNKEQAAAVIRMLYERGVPWTIMGRGSNLLVSDKGIRGVVIKLGNKLESLHFDGATVVAGAVGAGLAAADLGAAGFMGARAGAGALMGATSFAARGGATVAGGAATAYGLAAASSGETGIRRAGAGLTGVAKAGAGSAVQSLRNRISPSATASSPEPASATAAVPDWAQRMRRDQTMSHGVSAAAHAVRSGDHGGGSSSVSLNEDNPS